MSESLKRIGRFILVASEHDAVVGDSKTGVEVLFMDYLKQNPDMVAEGFSGGIYDIDYVNAGYYHPENTKATVWYYCGEGAHEDGGCEGCYEEIFINVFDLTVHGMRPN